LIKTAILRRTRTLIRVRTVTVVPRGRLEIRAQFAESPEQEDVEDKGPLATRPENAAPLEEDETSHTIHKNLEKRHNCPVCPAGIKLLSGSPEGVRFCW
jgi:hypothetical protein